MAKDRNVAAVDGFEAVMRLRVRLSKGVVQNASERDGNAENWEKARNI